MTTFRQLLILLRPYRMRVAASLIMFTCVWLALLAIPMMARELLGSSLRSEATVVPGVIWLQFGVTLVLLVGMSFAALSIMFAVAHDVSTFLRTRYFRNLIDLPVDQHRRAHTGERINRLVSSLTDIEFFLKYTLLVRLGFRWCSWAAP